VHKAAGNQQQRDIRC